MHGLLASSQDHVVLDHSSWPVADSLKTGICLPNVNKSLRFIIKWLRVNDRIFIMSWIFTSIKLHTRTPFVTWMYREVSWYDLFWGIWNKMAVFSILSFVHSIMLLSRYILYYLHSFVLDVNFNDLNQFIWNTIPFEFWYIASIHPKIRLYIAKMDEESRFII